MLSVSFPAIHSQTTFQFSFLESYRGSYPSRPSSGSPCYTMRVLSCERRSMCCLSQERKGGKQLSDHRSATLTMPIQVQVLNCEGSEAKCAITVHEHTTQVPSLSKGVQRNLEVQPRKSPRPGPSGGSQTSCVSMVYHSRRERSVEELTRSETPRDKAEAKGCESCQDSGDNLGRAHMQDGDSVCTYGIHKASLC